MRYSKVYLFVVPLHRKQDFLYPEEWQSCPPAVISGFQEQKEFSRHLFWKLQDQFYFVRKLFLQEFSTGLCLHVPCSFLNLLKKRMPQCFRFLLFQESPCCAHKSGSSARPIFLGKSTELPNPSKIRLEQEADLVHRLWFLRRLLTVQNRLAFVLHTECGGESWGKKCFSGSCCVLSSLLQNRL